MSIKGSTTEVTPTEAIAELLSTADASVWSTTTPSVFEWWERSQSERGPGDGMPPELYVWQPTGASLERFSADGDLLVESPTVEIYVFTLSEADTRVLARDVIKYLSEFMSDNYQNSEYADIQPTAVEDFREQKMTAKTNHYVYTVECDIERETTTGVA